MPKSKELSLHKISTLKCRCIKDLEKLVFKKCQSCIASEYILNKKYYSVN